MDWALLWEYRDLLVLLVHREFASKYKQTILGPAWFILQPLMTSLVFTIFMGRVAKMPTDDIPAVLFYLCNQLSWNYLQQNLGTGGSIFTNNANLFGKVYFPRLVVPISVVLSNLFACVLQLASFLAFFVGFKLLAPGAGVFNLSPSAIVLVPLLYLCTGAALAGRVPLDVLAHGEVPRSDPGTAIGRPALDVRLARDLPALEFSRQMALGGRDQPDDGNPRILPSLPAGQRHAHARCRWSCPSPEPSCCC